MFPFLFQVDVNFRLLYIKKMDNKTNLRTKAKNIRKTLPMREISTNLTKLIQLHPYYKSANNVMLFYPTKYEVDLLELLIDNKNFYLPKVNENKLEVCSFYKDDKLEKSSFNILEPCTNPVNPTILDLVIVPALMADKKGYRLGYGGGFYDRFLTKFGKNFKTITPIPQELFVDSLPIDEFDKKIDAIISV